jgi:hypothetical protein
VRLTRLRVASMRLKAGATPAIGPRYRLCLCEEADAAGRSVIDNSSHGTLTPPSHFDRLRPKIHADSNLIPASRLSRTGSARR